MEFYTEQQERAVLTQAFYNTAAEEMNNILYRIRAEWMVQNDDGRLFINVPMPSLDYFYNLFDEAIADAWSTVEMYEEIENDLMDEKIIIKRAKKEIKSMYDHIKDIRSMFAEDKTDAAAG